MISRRSSRILGGTMRLRRRGWHAPDVGRGRRNDPYDPATARHLGQCEFVGVTDAARLRAVLRVTPKDGYDWVECNACDIGWQVPYYAESVG
jgi:hypothetical protein